MSSPTSSMLRSALVLAALSIGGVALLSSVHLLTRDRIEEQQQLLVRQRLAQVLPMDRYDNDLLSDFVTVRDAEAFGHARPVRVFRARRDGQPAAVIMEITAPDGYNGPIVMLAGIDYDGVVTGVRVVSHKETPGLGDPIEAHRSDWINDFRDRSLGNPAPEGWAVRKDGGEFQQFTGATITPRAVVKAVKLALEYHRQHRDSLYDQPSEAPE